MLINVMSSISREINGLSVELNGLEYFYDASQKVIGTAHKFVYYITICNNSSQPVRLLCRKWIVYHPSGEVFIIEGDKIVGCTPLLNPGDTFNYSSYHLSGCSAIVEGSYHGIDKHACLIYVKIPRFRLVIPKRN